MLRDLKDELKIEYNHDEENLINDFYVKVLEKSTTYDRTTGDFGPYIFAKAAKGFSKFFFNHGKMRLLCSVRIQDEEFLEMLEKLNEKDDGLIPKSIEEKILSSIQEFEDQLIQNHIKCIAWLLKEKRLEIRFALMNNDRYMYHKKTGIFSDGEDIVAIYGSLNESARGWHGNEDGFVVFFSWYGESDNKRIQERQRNFESDWELGKKNNFITYSMSEAIEQKVLKTIENQMKEEFEKVFFKNKDEVDEASIEESQGPFSSIKWKVPPQTQSIENFNRNGKRGVLAIATGVGKTLIALKIIYDYLIEEIDTNKKKLVIIAVHNKDMIPQWRKEVDTWLDSYNSNVDFTMYDITGDRGSVDTQISNFSSTSLKSDSSLILITHYDLMRSLIENLVEKEDKLHRRHILFVADEVHEMGTGKRIEKFSQFNPEYRLGLSATPKRYFDEEGTDFILDYFRGNYYEDGLIYEYNLSDAIRDGFLCPYNYYTIECSLNPKETEEYKKKTKQIMGLEKKKDKTKQDEEYLFKLKNDRKTIINKASCKKEKILSLISYLKRKDQLKYVLVYLEDNDQLKEVCYALHDNDYRFKSITAKTSTGNRNDFLKDFRDGVTDILLAIDILDQGIDIPELRVGIIASSTGNEKQFIQRRGRLLRIHTQSGKDKALIYDLVVPYIDLSSSGSERIVRSEFERMGIFIEDCSNKEDHKTISGILKKIQGRGLR